MNHVQRREFFLRLANEIPEPETELEYQSPFELLIAVILSAQATDISVNKATRTLFAEANTPEQIVALGTARLKSHIRHIGLYNNKAKNIIATCRILIEKHAGEVPRTRKALESLPGVGRKTANVVLNTAFGEPTIAVDTHIFRVCNRTKIASGSTVLEVEKRLLKWVPQSYRQNAHHLLILHGRYTCTARQPRCFACCVEDVCEFKDKTPPSSE